MKYYRAFELFKENPQVLREVIFWCLKVKLHRTFEILWGAIMHPSQLV
jgi:hypothetical protein